LFFKASTDQASSIRNLLDDFESGTGQLVSLGKMLHSLLYRCPCECEVKHLYYSAY
jgi:hypothetical protein